MTTTTAALPTGRVVRKLVFTAVGVFLFAGGLTFLYLGMRAVMDVGGFCASGGPYQIRQECPDGTGFIFLGIFAGLIGTGLTAAGTFAGGPQLWTLAWPALFCALGWNFLEYGVDPPPPESGPVWGWLICAVTFFAMGGIPLLFVLVNAKSVLWGRSDGPATTARATLDRLRPSARAGGTPVAPFGSTTVASSADAAPPGTPTIVVFDDTDDSELTAEDMDAAGDLVRDLERLSALHREGALSDDEFGRAKAARLAQEDS